MKLDKKFIGKFNKNKTKSLYKTIWESELDELGMDEIINKIIRKIYESED